MRKILSVALSAICCLMFLGCLAPTSNDKGCCAFCAKMGCLDKATCTHECCKPAPKSTCPVNCTCKVVIVKCDCNCNEGFCRCSAYSRDIKKMPVKCCCKCGPVCKCVKCDCRCDCGKCDCCKKQEGCSTSCKCKSEEK